VLVHQNTVRLADFGLSVRIKKTSNSQSKTFALIPYTDPKSFNSTTMLNEKSDIYSIGVLLCEISSGQLSFHDKHFGNDLALSILQGIKDTPILDATKEYIKVYTGK
jgi:serine/threonine protein kinase